MRAQTSLHPSDLVLRCVAMRRGRVWVALCIDLDLAAQADTRDQVKALLNEQIESYVSDALGRDRGHVVSLLGRRAPLRYWLLFYVARWLSRAQRLLSYETGLPVELRHA